MKPGLAVAVQTIRNVLIHVASSPSGGLHLDGSLLGRRSSKFETQKSFWTIGLPHAAREETRDQGGSQGLITSGTKQETDLTFLSAATIGNFLQTPTKYSSFTTLVTEHVFLKSAHQLVFSWRSEVTCLVVACARPRFGSGLPPLPHNTLRTISLRKMPELFSRTLANDKELKLMGTGSVVVRALSRPHDLPAIEVLGGTPTSRAHTGSLSGTLPLPWLQP